MIRRIRWRNLALALAAAALLGGCGSHSPGGGSAGQTQPKTVAKKAINPSDELSHNMVSAVASNKPSTLPVQVKFELRDRPDVGQPVEVDLAIVPMSASVDRVSGKVEAEDGLELIEGSEIAAADRPAEGVPIRHLVKVLPKREGIYTVRAVLTVDAAGVSSTEAYSLPVIAAAAPTESSGKPSAPAPAGSAAAPATARVSEARPATPATAAAQ
ncbi:MAG TPA: hypothetical protein VNY25_01950 [Steroidobacteraceae bacterium]|jgi:hypothetical protein|nr:hypothetical protein [Steroidobacteraceae bacterium]